MTGPTGSEVDRGEEVRQLVDRRILEPGRGHALVDQVTGDVLVERTVHERVVVSIQHLCLPPAQEFTSAKTAVAPPRPASLFIRCEIEHNI